MAVALSTTGVFVIFQIDKSERKHDYWNAKCLASAIEHWIDRLPCSERSGPDPRDLWNDNYGTRLYQTVRARSESWIEPTHHLVFDVGGSSVRMTGMEAVEFAREIRRHAAICFENHKRPGDSTCDCGAPKPCKFHDTTPDMQTAMSLLEKMQPEQRTRLFCWFDSNGTHIPPSATSKTTSTKENP